MFDHTGVKGFLSRCRGRLQGRSLVPDIELKLPAVGTLQRLAPELEGTHFGETNGQLHRERLCCAASAVSEHGADRGEASDLILRKADEIAEMIPQAGEGGEQLKAGGLVGEHLKGWLVEPGVESFLGATRDQANRLECLRTGWLRSTFSHFDVIGAGTAGAHAHPLAEPHQPVIGSTHRDSQFGTRVCQLPRSPAGAGFLLKPGTCDVEQTPAHGFRGQRASVEQDEIGTE